MHGVAYDTNLCAGEWPTPQHISPSLSRIRGAATRGSLRSIQAIRGCLLEPSHWGPTRHLHLPERNPTVLSIRSREVALVSDDITR